MTEREIALLRAICETDHKVYTPESRVLDTPFGGITNLIARHRRVRSCVAVRPGRDRREAEGRSYSPQTIWFKIKNRAYTQGEGRDLFQKPQRLATWLDAPPGTVDHARVTPDS